MSPYLLSSNKKAFVFTKYINATQPGQVDAQPWTADPCPGEVHCLTGTLANQNSLQMLQAKTREQAQYREF